MIDNVDRSCLIGHGIDLQFEAVVLAEAVSCIDNQISGKPLLSIFGQIGECNRRVFVHRSFPSHFVKSLEYVCFMKSLMPR